jgi:hypothetical protein
VSRHGEAGALAGAVRINSSPEHTLRTSRSSCPLIAWIVRNASPRLPIASRAWESQMVYCPPSRLIAPPGAVATAFVNSSTACL